MESDTSPESSVITFAALILRELQNGGWAIQRRTPLHTAIQRKVDFKSNFSSPGPDLLTLSVSHLKADTPSTVPNRMILG
jgi:hypothetical protein